MSENDSKILLKAREAVYRLLNIRLRSEAEIITKLRDKKYASTVIDETISYFKELNYINDRVFAKAWIASRLKKPYGKTRIQMELYRKGIADNILQEELSKALDEFPEEDIVSELAIHRASKYKNIEPVKMKQRVYGYLQRRGFSSNAIRKALKNI